MLSDLLLTYGTSVYRSTLQKPQKKNIDIIRAALSKSAYLVLHGVAQVVVRVGVVCLQPQSRAVAADRFLFTGQRREMDAVFKKNDALGIYVVCRFDRRN